MLLKHSIVTVCLVLAACATPEERHKRAQDQNEFLHRLTQPFIVDLREDKVVVQMSALGAVLGKQKDVIRAAERGCATFGRTPSLINQICIGAACKTERWLFACVP